MNGIKIPMGKLAIAVHGGAGPDSDFIKQNLKGYKKGLAEAAKSGYNVLEKGGSAIDAVETAVNSLEDNPLFNAGRGSAINAKAEVEMCASIMDGKNLNSGAVAIVKNVKNPVSLARAVMQNTKHIYLGGHGALDYAKQIAIQLEPDAYFITDHQYDAYNKKRKEEFESNRETALEQLKKRTHGTVGAVALDKEGNIAAATSTGGTENCKEGRIGDSSMVGIGVYADNKTCAVSTTGEGEFLIRNIIAHNISAVMEYKGYSLKKACNYVLNVKCKEVNGDIGFIALDAKGNICIEYNSERMHRAWMSIDEPLKIKIYK